MVKSLSLASRPISDDEYAANAAISVAEERVLSPLVNGAKMLPLSLSAWTAW
jgi:hypothetical protein